MTHRAAWLTDIHLNFVTPERVAGLAESICRRDVDSILIGGDIGEGAAECGAPRIQQIIELE